MEDDPLLIARPLAIGARLVFIAIGAFVILVTLWELGAALWPPNLFTPFFGIIVGGAWFVGGGVLTAALKGEDQRWRFEPGRIVVERRVWSKLTENMVTGEDIANIVVIHDASNDGPDTWFVRLQLKGGTDFDTQEFGSPAYAEKIAAQIRRHLGLPDGTAIP